MSKDQNFTQKVFFQEFEVLVSATLYMYLYVQIINVCITSYKI